ncbi:L,D-transpeptidase [Modicisalibacter tunisiensis]|uniref:L,D-transpeptidase family protein n=1 Tax=Modicisalibacter tunisiensis TaxID=390637 RepID=UPI001CCD0350|nr:L,D-transpeptidase [Modicisalibacter tunisiensis]MBZ9538554.1 L,D-transpeptidase [Modicisalibacter tunisiensis]
MKRAFWWVVLGMLFVLPSWARAVPETDKVWVLIDHASSTLTVYRGQQEIERFHPVAVGRRGVADTRLRGDMTTPSGVYHVTRFNYDSDFHLFIGLDFPNLTQARRAEETGVLSEREFERYLRFYRRHGRPPQDTVLGGDIGIHGLGQADPVMHRRFNWTQGCVAVTNPQIDRLGELVQLGTKVIIR